MQFKYYPVVEIIFYSNNYILIHLLNQLEKLVLTRNIASLTVFYLVLAFLSLCDQLSKKIHFFLLSPAMYKNILFKNLNTGIVTARRTRTIAIQVVYIMMSF